MKIAFVGTKFLQVVVLTLLGALSGVAILQSSASQWALHLVCVVCATIIALVLCSKSWLATLLGIFAHYGAYFFVCMAWFGDNLTREATLGIALGNAMFVIVCALLAIPIALGTFAGLAVASATRSASLAGALVASGWSAGEFARAALFSDFSWGQAGYAYVESPFAALYESLGVTGVGWFVTAVSAATGVQLYRFVYETQQRGRAAALCAALVAVLIAAEYRVPSSGQAQSARVVAVRLVQTNVSWQDKFSAAALRAHISQLADGIAQSTDSLVPELVVTPETALPAPWYAMPRDLRDRVARAVDASNASVLLGVLDFDESLGSVNRTVLASHLTTSGSFLPNSTYAKRTLVPIGETVPFGLGWLDELLALPANQRSIGPAGQNILHTPEIAIRPSICLDAVAPGELRTDAEFDIVTNQANFSWFLNNSMQEQWIDILRVRALELRKSVISVANAGPTFVIDSNGVVIAQTSGREFEVLTVSTPVTLGRTLYATLGNSLLVLLISATGVGFAAEQIGRRRRSSRALEASAGAT
jgi:apolipoprotein N-acyltransferase